MQKKIQAWVQTFQRYAGRWWYAPAIGLLAAADLFLVVIPTDGLLVSAVMLAPRRWVYSALMVTLGSSLGTVALGALLQVHGMPFLLHIVPGIDHSSAWLWTKGLMDTWGIWAVFLIALSPLMQHPAVALAALAGMRLTNLFLMVFGGRILKYLLLAYLAKHAPGTLGKLWGLQQELEDVGFNKKGPQGNGLKNGASDKASREAKSLNP